jgi:NADH:ubiquinone oxidoreductase subunit 3 (subunit A)
MIEFVPVLQSVFLAAGISVLLLSLSFFLGTSAHNDPEKISAYECGFDPFSDARSHFDVRFYLVSILFLIFDLEVSFLFPWAVCLHSQSTLGFWSMMIFLAILTLGFVYEWKKGALDWE